MRPDPARRRPGVARGGLRAVAPGAPGRGRGGVRGHAVREGSDRRDPGARRAKLTAGSRPDRSAGPLPGRAGEADVGAPGRRLRRPGRGGSTRPRSHPAHPREGSGGGERRLGDRGRHGRRCVRGGGLRLRSRDVVAGPGWNEDALRKDVRLLRPGGAPPDVRRADAGPADRFRSAARHRGAGAEEAAVPVDAADLDRGQRRRRSAEPVPPAGASQRGEDGRGGKVGRGRRQGCRRRPGGRRRVAHFRPRELAVDHARPRDRAVGFRLPGGTGEPAPARGDHQGHPPSGERPVLQGPGGGRRRARRAVRPRAPRGQESGRVHDLRCAPPAA